MTLFKFLGPLFQHFKVSNAFKVKSMTFLPGPENWKTLEFFQQHLSSNCRCSVGCHFGNICSWLVHSTPEGDVSVSSQSNWAMVVNNAHFQSFKLHVETPKCKSRLKLAYIYIAVVVGLGHNTIKYRVSIPRGPERAYYIHPGYYPHGTRLVVPSQFMMLLLLLFWPHIFFCCM